MRGICGMDAEWKEFCVYLLPWVTVGLLLALFFSFKLKKSGHSALAGILLCFQVAVWFLWPLFLGIYIIHEQRKNGYKITLNADQISGQRRQELEQLELKQVKIETPCPCRICKAYALVSDSDIILVKINRITASVQKLPRSDLLYQDEFGNIYSLRSGGTVRMEHMVSKAGYLGGAPINIRL